MLPAATTQFLPKVTPSRIVALAPIQVPDLISTPFLVTPCSLMGAVLSVKAWFSENMETPGPIITSSPIFTNPLTCKKQFSDIC